MSCYQLYTSHAYWRYCSGNRDQYTIYNIALDIEPVQVSVQGG